LSGGRSGALGAFFTVAPPRTPRSAFNLPGPGSFHPMSATRVIIIAAILLNRLIDTRMGRE